MVNGEPSSVFSLKRGNQTLSLFFLDSRTRSRSSYRKCPFPLVNVSPGCLPVSVIAELASRSELELNTTTAFTIHYFRTVDVPEVLHLVSALSVVRLTQPSSHQ